MRNFPGVIDESIYHACAKVAHHKIGEIASHVTFSHATREQAKDMG